MNREPEWDKPVTQLPEFEKNDPPTLIREEEGRRAHRLESAPEVIILKNSYSPAHDGTQGGLEKYTDRSATFFAKRGCRVTLLTTTPRRPPKSKRKGSPPYRIRSLGRTFSPSVLNLLAFDHRCREWISREKPPFVFGMDRNSYQTHYRVGEGVHAAFLRRRCQAESRWKSFSFPLNPLHRTILSFEKQTLESPRIRGIFTNSWMVREEILSHYSISDPSKIHVIHNGVEWEELSLPFASWEEGRAETAQRFQLDLNRFQFLFIGHGFRRKGLTYLLKGLALLPKDSFQLVCVGKERNLGPYLKQIRTLGLEGAVRLVAEQERIYPFLQTADALVIPSLYDPFANVTVEALAMGVQVISSQFNGGKEILNGQNGTLIEDIFEPDSMAKALQEALARPKSHQQACSIRESVRQLNFPNQLNKLVDLILYS